MDRDRLVRRILYQQRVIMGDTSRLQSSIDKLAQDVAALIAATPADDQAAIDAAQAAVDAVDATVVAATASQPVAPPS